MNEQHRTTAPDVAPDFEKAFDALEAPIATNARRLMAIDWVVGHMMDRKPDKLGRRSYADEELEVLYYLVCDCFEAAKLMDAQWQEAS